MWGVFFYKGLDVQENKEKGTNVAYLVRDVGKSTKCILKIDCTDLILFAVYV